MIMEEIAVLGDEETVIGFKLAGVRRAVVVDANNADEKFNELVANSKVGLIILSEDTQKLFSQKTLKTIENLTKPIVLTIPGKTAKPTGINPLTLMIKKVIGIDLNTK